VTLRNGRAGGGGGGGGGGGQWQVQLRRRRAVGGADTAAAAAAQRGVGSPSPSYPPPAVSRAGRTFIVHAGPFRLRFTYAPSVLVTRLRMETPGQAATATTLAAARQQLRELAERVAALEAQPSPPAPAPAPPTTTAGPLPPPAAAAAPKAKALAFRSTVMRCDGCELLVDNRDEWVRIGAGFVIGLCFLKGATEATVPLAVNTLLSMPVRAAPLFWHAQKSLRACVDLPCVGCARGAWDCHHGGRGAAA
jgi:hypothetical protein